MRSGFWLAAFVLAASCTVNSQGPAPAANYAIFSPEAISKLPAQRDSPAARRVMGEAKRFVDGAPHPMSRVHTEGILEHQGIHDESAAAEKDWDGMLALGLAYRISGDKQFLAAEDRYLGAWTAVYRISLDPIDETNMDRIVMAYDLTRGDLSPKTEHQAAALWRSMAEGYISWMEKNGKKDIANWSSHRVELAVMAAYETGDPDLEARAAAVFHSHLKRNIRPDGSVEDFYKRDALHYVTYDLEPLEMAALAAGAHGQSWFHEGADGRNLAHAVDWLLPYAFGQKQHIEFVHSRVEFDAARDRAGEKGFSGPWDPAAGVQTLALAALLDPHYDQALQQSVKPTGHNPQAWPELFAAVNGSPL